MALNFETQRDYENPEIDIRSELLDLKKEIINGKRGTKETTSDEILETGENTEIEQARKIIEQGLAISEIKRLTPELAKELVNKNSESSTLDLYKLKTLDVETAKELLKFKGIINFDGGYSDRGQGLRYDEYEQRCQQIFGQLSISLVQKKQETAFGDDLGSIEYIGNGDSEMIKSYGNTVKFRTNRFSCYRKSFDCNGNYGHYMNFVLEGLNYSFAMNVGLWLANFKNRIKSKYGDKKVEYKRDIVNKSFGVEKTLCIGNTMLLSRGNLERRLNVFHESDVRHEDKFMEELADWLNK